MLRIILFSILVWGAFASFSQDLDILTKNQSVHNIERLAEEKISKVKKRNDQQHYVKLHIDHSADLVNQDTLKIGFTYDNRKGKQRKKGRLFRRIFYAEKFKLEVHGAGKYHPIYKVICVDRKKIAEGISDVIVKYSHPYFPSLTHVDTLKFPVCKKITLLHHPLSFGDSFPLKVKADFVNGDSKEFKGRELRRFFKKYRIKTDIVNASWKTSSLIQIPYFKEELLFYSNVIFHSQYASWENTVDFNFNIYKNIDASGRNGENGDNLKIMVQEQSENLYVMNVQNQTQNREYVYLFRADSSRFLIDARGGNGEDGSRGSRGVDGGGAGRGNQVTSGASGGGGENGEDGGNGGHVDVFLPKSFYPFLNSIVIQNHGGQRGEGGSGGLGGNDVQMICVDGKWVPNTLSSRAPSGQNGKAGIRGENGKVQYYFMD